MIDISTWKKAWELLDGRERRNAWIVLAVVVIAALSSAVMIGSVMPFLSVLADPGRIHSISTLAWIYQAGGFTSDYAFLIALGLASLAVIVGANLVLLARTWVVVRYTTMRMHRISARLLAAYLRQPYEFFLDQHSGAMNTHVLSEVQQVAWQFFMPAANIIASFLTIAVIVVLLVWINPAVALAAFALFGGIYGGTYFFSRKVVARRGQIRAAANEERFRIAGEALGGIKDIKLLGREAAYLQRFQVHSERMVRTQIVANLIGQTPQYVMQTVAFGGMIVLCLVMVEPDALTSGKALGGILPLLGVFAFAGQRMMPELQKLYQSLTQIQFGKAAVDSIHADLVHKAVGGDILPVTPPAPLGLKRELRLEGVGYYYPKAEAPGLNDISLAIKAGEKIGVVGSSGAGKTTLADLVLGLLRPSEGEMIVDGVAVTHENIRSWQQSVGYVPQDIFLTDSSIAQNIALGIVPEEIDRARVEQAAITAQLDTFIRSDLPEGYDTGVGERGIRLSGGQRQRIGIARAMYHNADLIVFDEATSALDNVTEREVMSAIDNLPGGKTVLIIAHRLTTVQRCDRILMLDRGRIAGFDNWDVLMAQSEDFRKIALAV